MLYDRILKGEEKLSVVGLGYVGMPIAVAFAKKGISVIGFDVNEEKIALYRQGVDPTQEVGNEVISASTVDFTADAERLKEARFHIIAVPTPVNHDKTPDLSPVIGASRMLGKYLMPGSIVVYESTVYPGVTEEVCVPILEEVSGLKCGVDFKVGYSPERINPGDRVHRLENIRKIVSGMDEQTLREVEAVYNIVIEVGTFPVSTIKTAEAIKVVENSQRDVNIAFMNELAMIFDRMGIDTDEVVKGMNTKWNALGFRPGLVGGHCIGIDPYYMTYQAEMLGYHSKIILAGRQINDGMGRFVAESAIKEMVRTGIAPVKAKVAVLGLTFKENCPDIRNSKVVDIITELSAYGVPSIVCDPIADAGEVKAEYGLELTGLDQLQEVDCLILAVAHEAYAAMSMEELKRMLKPSAVVIDVKSILDAKALKAAGYRCWRL